MFWRANPSPVLLDMDTKDTFLLEKSGICTQACFKAAIWNNLPLNRSLGLAEFDS